MLEIELGNSAEQAGHDHEFRLRDMMAHWTKQCASASTSDVELQEITCALVEYELKLEVCATLPTPRIVKALETARLCAPRVVFVSDSYMSEADIRRLLARNGLLEFFDGGYVSSEHMLTKRSGRLFERVLNRRLAWQYYYYYLSFED